MEKRNIRISLAIDEKTSKAIDILSQEKGLPKSSVIFSIIYQNDEVQRIIKKNS